MVDVKLKATGGWIDVRFEGDTVTMAAVGSTLLFLVKEPATTAQRQKRTEERSRYRRMALDALLAGGAGDALDEVDFVWTHRAG